MTSSPASAAFSHESEPDGSGVLPAVRLFSPGLSSLDVTPCRRKNIARLFRRPERKEAPPFSPDMKRSPLPCTLTGCAAGRRCAAGRKSGIRSGIRMDGTGMTENSEAPGRGYFREGLLPEEKQKNAAARCFLRRGVSFFLVKSGGGAGSVRTRSGTRPGCGTGL